VWKRPSQGETDRQKFALAAMTHLENLYRIAFHLAHEENEAQDLVQETFARALTSYKQFEPGTNMKAWLTKILHNFFLDRQHQRKRWVSVQEESLRDVEGSDYWDRVQTDNPGPESLLLGKELNIKIAEALRKIPEEFRSAILLVDMEDFSYVEAAEILACPVGTVRSRLSRGRRLLHKQLKVYVGQKDKEKDEV
jgi:RNA polymerase sigma-70 factor, ECF subfamily